MSRLRVGCIGTGFIAGRHLSALAGFADVEIVAVADAARDRAQNVAARYGATAYDDGLALLDSEQLDAVWLCVPPFAHGDLEHAALERDVAMFVEKPLGLDLPTAVGIAAAVRARGTLTCVGYHWRSLSVVQQALAVVREHPVQLMTGTWLDSTPPAPWWSRRTGSGGQLVEQTTHLVDLARLLVGEVDSVQALEVGAPPQAGPDVDVPTASAVLLRFRTGAVGTISSTRVLARRDTVGLQLAAPGRLLELRERALSDHDLRIADGDGQQLVQTLEDPVAREDRAFLDALQAGTDQVPVCYEEALRTHAVVCAADDSARAGGTVVDVQEQLRAQGRVEQESGPARPPGDR